MKNEIELKRAKWLVEPGCVLMVTSGNMETPNVMTFSRKIPHTPLHPWQSQILHSKFDVRYSMFTFAAM
jgi:hypothetical protein